MIVSLNGKSYKAVKTNECDEKYLEYNVLYDGELIGKVARYDSEVHYSAWDNKGKLVGTRMDIIDTIEMLASEYVMPAIY